MKFENLRVEKITRVVQYKPDIASWHAENRKDHIIGVNISGSCDHDLGYKKMNMSPDFVYFFNQRDDFYAYVREAGYCYSIHFTTSAPIETDSFCKKVNNIEEILKMIERVERSRLRGEDNELETLSEFYKVCDYLLKLERDPYTKKDMRMIRAKEYIDIHFREKHCLDEAVELSQVSHRRFNDIFRLNVGTTPNKYIIEKRLEYAKELMGLGHLSIGEISDMSGFSDIYYFSKIFKRYMGIAPGKYRRGENDD